MINSDVPIHSRTGLIKARLLAASSSYWSVPWSNLASICGGSAGHAGAVAASEAHVCPLQLLHVRTTSAIKFKRLSDPVVSKYRRTPSAWSRQYEEGVRKVVESPEDMDILDNPSRAYGFPGSILLDVDGDGDLDVFVPSGPGQEHALFVNKLAEDGNLSFTLSCGARSCAASYGLAFPELDGNGVCSGDIDNDGDQVTHGAI